MNLITGERWQSFCQLSRIYVRKALLSHLPSVLITLSPQCLLLRLLRPRQCGSCDLHNECKCCQGFLLCRASNGNNFQLLMCVANSGIRRRYLSCVTYVETPVTRGVGVRVAWWKTCHPQKETEVLVWDLGLKCIVLRGICRRLFCTSAPLPNGQINVGQAWLSTAKSERSRSRWWLTAIGDKQVISPKWKKPKSTDSMQPRAWLCHFELVWQPIGLLSPSKCPVL